MAIRRANTNSHHKRLQSKAPRKNPLTYQPLEPRQLLATFAVQSGSWHDAATWDAGVPNSSERAVIPNGFTVTLGGTNHVAKELVIQGVLDVAESPGVNKSLTSDWIHVNSGGVFQIGTAANRYDANDFVITLTGDDPTENFTIEGLSGPITDNNGFLMAAGGGRLQFFGKDKLTFTKLAATADANANQILVEKEIDRDFDGDIDADDGSVNWEVGDEIVIASSSRDYNDEEVRLITAISDQGNGTVLITLDSALNHRHYGEIETYGNGSRTWDIDLRAEVAMISRNVKIQGEASHDTDNFFGDRARFDAGTGDGFGGHTMIMGTAGQITIDSVQFHGMGQTARLGRYPIHWHIAGDRTGDVLRGASITNSNNRGLTIHATHNVLIQDVVLHDVQGHGFFMEDGVETGNQYIANIAFGIHKVGRSDAVGNFAPDVNDPFIVDTHDHVGQNQNRFLSSSAYWITNPDNTWIGNISAGSEGTGFWFILPDFAIGASADDPQYDGVRANRTNLRQFDFNSSHSSPAGLNFDRGHDIEVPVGATLDPFFAGRNYLPPAEPQINDYTAYKHRVGVYHRGFIADFHENKYADNFISTFITFTQTISDTLYVGHSRGNANTSDRVTGHSIYDGANTITGIHFAGYDAANAHTFRGHSSARRHTHHVFSNTTFENDGSANNISIATQTGGSSHSTPFGMSASGLYDVDGTLTGHVGGGAGSTVIADHPFFHDSNDVKPSGWNAWVSDDLYAMLGYDPINDNADFKITSPDGDSATTEGGTNTVVKANAGDYTIEFPEGLSGIADGFALISYTRVGPSGSNVLRIKDVAGTLVPRTTNEVSDLTALRNSTSSAYTIVGDDIWMKLFSFSNRVWLDPAADQLIAVDDTAVTDEDNSVTINVLTNDSDPENDPLIVRPEVGDYVDDFQSPNAFSGWQYLWNESGELGDTSTYASLSWDSWRYRPSSGNFPYASALGAHPGDGFNESSDGLERYSIAAFTVPADGNYSITDSLFTVNSDTVNGVNLAAHVSGGSVIPLGEFFGDDAGSFDTSLGFLTKGQVVYVGLGANESKGADGSNWDFSIHRSDGPANGQITYNADNTITYTPNPDFNGTDSFSYIVTDGNGNFDTATVTVTVNPVADVMGEFLFYNDSSFDDASDANAIAPDKVALLPGQTATFANYTSYSKGINGLVINTNDFSTLPTLSTIGQFFEFRMGNDNAVGSWATAPGPNGVTVESNVDGNGTDRVVLTWADNAIENTWLQVVTLANADTGLISPSVFYYGNAIGETGDDASNARVNLVDVGLTRTNQTGFNSATIDSLYDFDRSGRVNLVDVGLVRVNQSGFSSLQLISPPASSARNSSGDSGDDSKAKNNSTFDTGSQFQLRSFDDAVALPNMGRFEQVDLDRKSNLNRDAGFASLSLEGSIHSLNDATNKSDSRSFNPIESKDHESRFSRGENLDAKPPALNQTLTRS